MTQTCTQFVWNCTAHHCGVVNTQTRTHAQIHTYAQIPAYVQLPVLFQPRVLLQPSTHLHHSQGPCPTMIPADPPVLAEALIITCRLGGISVDGSTMAVPDPFSFHTLMTGS